MTFKKTKTEKKSVNSDVFTFFTKSLESIRSLLLCRGRRQGNITKCTEVKFRGQGLLVNPTAAITNSSLACSRSSVEGRKASKRVKNGLGLGKEHLCSCYGDLTKGQRQSL